jgi:hypothetical protein
VSFDGITWAAMVFFKMFTIDHLVLDFSDREWCVCAPVRRITCILGFRPPLTGSTCIFCLAAQLTASPASRMVLRGQGVDALLITVFPLAAPCN